jgi:uracil phosphoribosyltransferase
MTAPLNVVGHPLIQHKLTLMRERDRSIKNFRELTNEIGMLLCYEVTRDLPLEMVDIETPLTAMKAPVIAGKKLTFAPILRAGVGFLDGMLALVPSARVAHIGLYRDHETLQAVEYYFKAPQDLSDRTVIMMDPMLATGNSACAAAALLKSRGALDIRFVCLLAAPEGIAHFQQGASGHSRVDRRRRREAERSRLHPTRPWRRGRPHVWHQVMLAV